MESFACFEAKQNHGGARKSFRESKFRRLQKNPLADRKLDHEDFGQDLSENTHYNPDVD
jgi:hypothetical protein